MTREQIMANDNMILKIKVGSNLYGTNTPESDEDYSGIFIANKDYHLGLKRIDEVDLSVICKKENSTKNSKDAIDFKLYELKKFIKLASDCNPNIIEQLFVNPENILFKNIFGNHLIINKHKFLHKGLKEKFIGYALSQRKKMQIKLDNRKSLNYFIETFTNDDSRILAELDYNKYESKNFIVKKEHIKIGDINFAKTYKVKRVYKDVQNRLKSFTHRKSLMDAHGFDTKFASHLIRLLLEGIELLSTGDLIFPLTHKDKILDIKKGKLTLKEVLQYSDDLEEDIRVAVEKSDLPCKKRFDEINDLCMTLFYEFYNKRN
jgi:predicted nucleotidyltransferase